MAHLDLLTLHAYELVGKSEFEPVRFECLPVDDPHFYRVSDASGYTVCFDFDVHDRWCEEWQKRTGKCMVCAGKGRKVVACRTRTGAVLKPCSACNGSGEHKENEE
jgi:hypothetical protein